MPIQQPPLHSLSQAIQLVIFLQGLLQAIKALQKSTFEGQSWQFEWQVPSRLALYLVDMTSLVPSLANLFGTPSLRLLSGVPCSKLPP